MLKQLFRKFLCLIRLHDWTCKAGEGIKPTKEEVALGLEGFKMYAQGYCKYCHRPLRVDW